MGDKCWIQMIFRKEDQGKFEKILGDCWDNTDEENGVMTGNAYEVNYGLYEEREELAETGLTFYGHHGAGGDYNDCVFACHNKHHVESNADFDGRPVVAINTKTGEISQIDLSIFYNYRRVYLDAKEYIERGT